LLLFPVIFPQDGIAFVVDSALGHPRIMIVVKMHGPLEEIFREATLCNLHRFYVFARFSVKRHPAVGAETILETNIFFADLSPHKERQLVIVYW
jgi:hypothetical protein